MKTFSAGILVCIFSTVVMAQEVDLNKIINEDIQKREALLSETDSDLKSDILPFGINFIYPINDEVRVVVCHGGSGLPMYNVFIYQKSGKSWKKIKHFIPTRLVADMKATPHKAIFKDKKLSVYDGYKKLIFDCNIE